MTTPRPLALTTDPIAQLTWRIAIPASVGMFFNTLFNFVDTYCAGLLGTDALAALSLSFPLYFMLIAVGSGLSQGTTALLANALGAGHREEARHVFAQSLLLAVVSGVLFSLAGILGAPALFRWLGADGNYLALTLANINVILGGGVFFILTMAINSALVAQGETRIYRNFLILGFVANCALNPLLMWGLFGLPRLGVAGVALATVLVQIGGCVLLGLSVRRGHLFHALPRALFRPDPAVLRRLGGQSIPAALNMMTIALGILVTTWFVKHFGKEAIAAAGIATRIEQVVLMPAIGLGSAMLSLVGQNHGAGLPHRVREAWLTNVKHGAGLMLIGALIVGFGGRAAMRVFSNDAAVIAQGGNYLRASAFTLAAYPILFVTVFMMQGLKRPAYGLWIGLYRQIAAPLIVIHTLAFTLGWGVNGIWWGVSTVNWSAALFALWYGWRTVRPSRQASPNATAALEHAS
jgi:putative MATE family efflux protein